MKINQMPIREDVIKTDIAAYGVSFVTIIDENEAYLVEAALSMYLREKCKYCGKEYKTLDDLKDTVRARAHEHCRLACRSCWLANNEAGIAKTDSAIV